VDERADDVPRAIERCPEGTRGLRKSLLILSAQ
jgi:hypothetical protein